MPSLIDLHCHSTVSDGVLPPTDLVNYAADCGILALALTDHDDLGGLDEAARAAKSRDVRFIPGVEISVTWRKRTLHIVGLRIDPTYPPLLEGLHRIRAGRHTRAEGMAAGLSKIGIHGSLEGAYQYSKESIISRTHFARFLVEKGYAKDTRSVFKKYLVKGKPGYFEHEWTSLDNAVRWITGSGGVAVIAHPGRYDLGRINTSLLMNEFRNLGGTSIEVVTGSHSVPQYQQFAKIAKQFSFSASTGSDYHGPGQSYIEMGRMPSLPLDCVPVWKNWPEVRDIVVETV